MPGRELQHALPRAGVDRLHHPLRDGRPEGADLRCAAHPARGRLLPVLGARDAVSLRRVGGISAAAPSAAPSPRSGLSAHTSSHRELSAQQLARTGARQRPLDRRDLLGDLVRGQARRAVRAQLIAARLRPGACTTSAVTASPQRSSARPITAASSTAGVLLEHCLDLGGCHVLPAADDRVGLAAGHVKVPILVQATQIPCAQPAVRARAPRATVGPARLRSPRRGRSAPACRTAAGPPWRASRANGRRGSLDLRERERGHLRARLREAVGEAHRDPRRAGALEQRGGHRAAAEERAAQGGWVLQACVEQPRERGCDERDDRHLRTIGLQRARARARCRSARAPPPWSRRSRCAPGSRGPPRGRAAGCTATARCGRGRAPPPSPARSRGNCRTSAPPASAPSGPRGVDHRGDRVQVVARPRPSARAPGRPRGGANRAPTGSRRAAARPPPPPPRPRSRARSRSPRRRSTGTATAPSSRQACSAYAKSRPAGSAIATRSPPARPAARARAPPRPPARARGAARRSTRPAGSRTAIVAGADAAAR